jgi:hypothetical protein
MSSQAAAGGGAGVGPPPQRDLLLIRYRENADQARHHEVLRERSTSMVAQTAGVMLGLLGLAQGTVATNPGAPFVGAFIILLGAWGIYCSVEYEARARRHRDRIDTILKALDPAHTPGPGSQRMIAVWVLFHIGVACAGVFVLVRWWCPTITR